MSAAENAGADAPYPHVESPDLPGIERRILERWETAKTFEESVEQRPVTIDGANNEYVFYDGPPFANGLPHHGHLLTGYVKDVVPRYQTMQGKRVERRFGWDCHGLPAEMEAEKELPVSGRASIIEYGIERFNEYCRTSVLKYTQDWEETVTRQARWVDFENDYKTMDIDYMESVMWAFKQLWDKGLVYQANRVLPYSWGAETPLSNHEIRLDDATRPRQDPAITVAFTLDDPHGIPGSADVDGGHLPAGSPVAILAWTTTPWTLPSNLALAVGPDLDYAVMADADGTRYILGEAVLEQYDKQLENAEQVGTVKGSDLVGRTYQPLLPYFADMAEVDPAKPHHGTNRAFVVLAGDFIDTSEGTGVVHMAPGFGEDDQRVGEEAGIGMVVPVDDSGRFTDDVVEWAGQNVLEANSDIIRHLRETGQLVRHDSYTHNYPHCWRTDTPIIYKAMPSWYVEVTAIRDRLLETNQEINWVPSHIRDGRFGMWLEGARDWSISRNRFWGSPIPVWVSDDPAYPRTDVYGSLDELEADFGVRPDNLHRPFIDELTRPNPDDPTGKSTMRRVPEVLDCWFESGSMPFAQVHYPFENKEWFDEHFPADFIVEYINQSRGWFYTMHVLSTALFDRHGFDNAICHGILLADDGAKLSKKLRNYTEPSEIFEKQGADALRWYFMSTNIVRGGDTRISDQAIDDVVRQVILPIWNAYSFFTLYANVEGHRATFRTDSTELLDRYILAKTRDLVAATESRMDAYDLPGAAMETQSFIDALNNWYIRRSRDRFWGSAGGGADTDGLDTLYTVLLTLVQVAAPLLPMITEEIWLGLTGGDADQPDSVHLCDWPDADAYPANSALVAAMDRLRDVASTGLRLREDQGLRVRLPLASVTVAGRDAGTLEPFADLLADELNVKSVHLTEEIGSLATFVLRPDGKALGPRLGKDVQTVFGAAKSGDWSPNDDGTVTAAGHVLAEDEYELALESPDDVVAAALRSNDAVVTLDTEVTEALAAEGLARDIVREVQNARKAEDLVVTDRIEVWFEVESAAAAEAITAHDAYIADQVLATSLTIGAGPDDLRIHEATIDGEPFRFTLHPTV
ncbi:MAG: isoleucine--tRNA ligase [Acidimicrobiales bacterium]|nr:isoleucine--tRNA ligase [Acidimicrobiales bacterium]